MVQPVSEEMLDFFELTDQSQYTEEMGLKLNVDSGMAIICQSRKGTGGIKENGKSVPPVLFRVVETVIISIHRFNPDKTSIADGK